MVVDAKNDVNSDSPRRRPRNRRRLRVGHHANDDAYNGQIDDTFSDDGKIIFESTISDGNDDAYDGELDGTLDGDLVLKRKSKDDVYTTKVIVVGDVGNANHGEPDDILDGSAISTANYPQSWVSTV
mmetsp:Transcript_27141/g.56516  ORF Transcript_27141/g.56516 Transcript_27141/m.56516 type:complete len:127 (+) Transcript_27141:334-714(+)